MDEKETGERIPHSGSKLDVLWSFIDLEWFRGFDFSLDLFGIFTSVNVI